MSYLVITYKEMPLATDLMNISYFFIFKKKNCHTQITVSEMGYSIVILEVFMLILVAQVIPGFRDS